MVNIIHSETHYDDSRAITAIEIKVKSIAKKDDGTKELIGTTLLSAMSQALNKTTLIMDAGESIKMNVNQKRRDVADLYIKLKKTNDLKSVDVANFTDALQRMFDEIIS